MYIWDFKLFYNNIITSIVKDHRKYIGENWMNCRNTTDVVTRSFRCSYRFLYFYVFVATVF